ncbi:zinc ribbon domain-containing protein [Frankia sp. CcI49]|uniref:Zn-ribbon domain-containing OB-fold protein n=1 Tax=Frankia sp. CcI49 TaxID=1745382 RepID=UPI000978C4FA|nr:zinc ribbon domain-containing protein [Frankia sp. CcI49]
MVEEVNRPVGMPDPVVAPVNEQLWRAAAAGRLEVQRCTGCGAHRYPPTDGCYRCTSRQWGWSTLPGTGTVYSYIWVPDRARSAGRDEPVLYNVAVVTLDATQGDPVRILSNVIDAWQQADLQVGQRVTFASVPFTAAEAAEMALPCFRILR